MRKKTKWSGIHLLIKLTSRQLWAYLITTFGTFYFLYIDGEHNWFLPLIIVWGTVTVLYMGGNILIDALGKMIEKGNLNVTQNNSINASLGGK
jgi:hypothetical protein